MGKHNYNFFRLFIIDDLLRNRRYGISVKEIRDRCEEEIYGSNTEKKPCIETVQRDLRLLEDGFDAPIKRDKVNGKYKVFYTDRSYSFIIPFSKSDLALFRLSLTKFRHLKETRLIKQMEIVLNKVEKSIGPDNAWNIKKRYQYVQFETPPSINGLQHMNKLMEAIKERKVVKFMYKNYHQTDEREFTIHPYLLREHEKWWYLVGKSGQIIIHLALDRIRGDITITDQEFVIDKNFNPDTHFEYSFGITVLQEEPTEFHLSFEWSTGQFVKSKPLHHTQKVTEIPGEEVQIKFKCFKSNELIRKILSYGHEVKVIKPVELKDKLIMHYQKALEQYSQ